jgi:phage-related protein
VLHVFQKKSTYGIETPRRELELVRARLRHAEVIDSGRQEEGL